MPPARRACSKSRSVREPRRPDWPLESLEATGWRLDGNEEGGTGDRGEGCLKRDARMEEGSGCVGEVAVAVQGAARARSAAPIGSPAHPNSIKSPLPRF